MDKREKEKHEGCPGPAGFITTGVCDDHREKMRAEVKDSTKDKVSQYVLIGLATIVFGVMSILATGTGFLFKWQMEDRRDFHKAMTKYRAEQNRISMGIIHSIEALQGVAEHLTDSFKDGSKLPATNKEHIIGAEKRLDAIELWKASKGGYSEPPKSRGP